MGIDDCISKKCFICHKDSKEEYLPPIEGAKREQNVLRKQLKVIFLLKKLFKIPERTCCQFLQQFGNPSTWVYWCYTCSILVDEAKNLFDQVTLFERKIDILRRNLEGKVVFSRKNEKSLGQAKTFKTKDEAAEVVRSLIIQNITNDIDSDLINSSEVLEMKIEQDPDEIEIDCVSAGLSSDNESIGDFSIGDKIIGDDDNESKTSFNKTEEINNEKDQLVLKLGKSSQGNDSTVNKSSRCQLKLKATSETNIHSDYSLETEKTLNLKESIHQCHLCSKIFSRKEKLRNHLLVHPQPCPICKEQFLDKNQLKSHVKIHEGEGMKNSNCTICHENLIDLVDVSNHRCNRMDDSDCLEDSEYVPQDKCKSVPSKNLIHKCSLCEKTFTSKFKLSRHLSIHADLAPDRKHFQCSKCEKAFRYQRNLRAHEKIHKSDNAFQCKVCDKNLSSSRSLSKHVRIHNGDNREKPFLCITCGNSFFDVAQLRRHSKLHTGERPHACQFCDMKFAFKSNLLAHERTHTGEKPFACSFCEMRFLKRSLLKKHTATHTGELPPHQCSFCDKRFYSEKETKRHETTHSTREKSYLCSICNKGLSSSYGLSEHMKIHSVEYQERPFLCNTCGKSFSAVRYLRNHEKRHTGEMPQPANLVT